MKLLKLFLTMTALTSLLACAQTANEEYPGVHVLQYHHVSEKTPAVTSISPDQFEQHLRYLKEHDFNVVAIEQAAEWVDAGANIPRKTVVITFDDGYDNVFENAHPTLKEYGFPYAVFVNPDLLEAHPSAYMSWQQLKTIDAEGATIVNHGQTHAHLIRRKDEETEAQWQARMKQDIVSAQHAIDAQLGEQPKYFAYPYGEYSPALEKLLKEWGFKGFAQHSGAWSQWSPTTAIPRFPASGRYANLETLSVKLNSLPMAVSHYTPADPLVSHSETRPTVTVELSKTEGMNTNALRCFAGTDVLEPNWDAELQFSVTPKNDIPIGRSRINCTAPSTSGGYHWFSVAFIRPDSEGSWPD
ncbi:polysaccharide deacetylase family protein [Idiomarina sp.]|uniref:polysaccharide deacetylase family protein n=1 Tax=Idiomarina sp. TaxID=1874361 RepID=UPI0025C61942|nr:polysaccharide deacetylase family protein [Idiomarina sp.]NQZ03163.1 polysaccharide deacetylase family protein [Idiomarina sp.]